MEKRGNSSHKIKKINIANFSRNFSIKLLFLETLVVLKFKRNFMYKTSCLKFIKKHYLKPVKFEGIGLHSGKKFKIKILPAKQIKELFLKELI